MTQNRILFLAAALLLVFFMQIILPMPGPLNYVFMGYACLAAMMTMNGVKVNWSCVMLLIAIAISILGNNIPVFFKPWPRFALFAMLIVGCSPLVDGQEVNRVKRQLCQGGLWACAIITLWSFVAYFTGQGQYIWGFVNGYMGVTGHPNFLGFFCMVTMVSLASLFFRCTKNKERYIIGGSWVACIVVLLLSASRSATGLGFIGSLAAAFLRLQKDTARRFRLYFIGVSAIILCWPIFAPYTDAMMKKEMNLDGGGEAMIAATRGSIWELRYQEIAESPIIGVGAYSCDINLENAQIFYSADNGSLELGSSYLGLISQCGWLGFICFLLILIPILLKTFRYAINQRTPYAQFYLPLLLVCLLHMFFEGYLMTAGAVQCVIVWMILGACDQCDRVADYPIFWEKQEPITPEQYEWWRDHQAKDGDKR